MAFICKTMKTEEEKYKVIITQIYRKGSLLIKFKILLIFRYSSAMKLTNDNYYTFPIESAYIINFFDILSL